MCVSLEGLCTIRDILERQVSRKLMCVVLVVLIAGVGVGVGDLARKVQKIKK